MKIEGRQRRTLVIGGIGAALIVVVGHGVLPLVRAWSNMGDRLDPKLEYVAKLRARVHGHDSLLARRNALVRQLGSLCGPEPVAEDKPSDEPEAESPEPKEAGEAVPPEKAESETPAEEKAENTPPAPAPDGTTETAKEGTSAPGAPESGAEGKAVEETAESPAESPATEEASGAKEGKVADEEKLPAGPPSSGGAYLATYLEHIAEQSGVKINRVSPRKQRTGQKARKHIAPVMLQLSVEGDIQGLIKALYAIEKGDRLMRIEQIQLRRNIEKGSAIEATLDVTGYEAVARRP